MVVSHVHSIDTRKWRRDTILDATKQSRAKSDSKFRLSTAILHSISITMQSTPYISHSINLHNYSYPLIKYHTLIYYISRKQTDSL